MSLNLGGFDPHLLNFSSNCDIVGQYFTTPKLGDNDTLTTAYFRQALPAEYRDNFTFADIGSYILLPGQSSAWRVKPESLAKKVCRHEICGRAYSDFRGNPDVSGTGVIVSYAIQCILSTLFRLVNLVYHSAKIEADESAKWPRRVITAVLRSCGFIGPQKTAPPVRMLREAQLVFLDASILFALAISVASFSTAKYQSTLYEVFFTGFVNAFVAVPLIPCLHDLWESKVYRRPLRVLFAIVASALGVSSAGYMWWKKVSRRFVDTDCAIVSNDSFVLIFAACGVVAVDAARFVLNFLKIPEWLAALQKRYKRTNSVITSVLVIYPLGLLVACWVIYPFFLFIVWTHRAQVEDVVGADRFDEKRMGFGQVVAVWLWVPVLIEFFALWSTGLEKGLTGRVLGGARCVIDND